MPLNKDPYEVLGVSRNASREEIKAAYRELVKKYHPDNYRNNPLEELAKEKMQEVTSAYDLLTGAGRQHYRGQAQDDPFQNGPFHGGPYRGGQARGGAYQNPFEGTPFRNAYRNQGRNPQGYYHNSAQGCFSCDTLLTLCCLDSCCECMGGDLCYCC